MGLALTSRYDEDVCGFVRGPGDLAGGDTERELVIVDPELEAIEADVWP